MNTTPTLFIIRSYCDDATLTMETNSVETMLDHFDTALECNIPCEVICGTTGEVLASHDCGCGEYASDAFIGLVMADAMNRLLD